MAVSIRDIAREAGVTVGTVSRALNNYPDVSPTTRERIVETAQRLGYRPNQMARNLSSKHNHNIALVSQLLDNSICAAGQTWSYNDTTGNCDEEKGFLGAGAIIDGEYTDSVGGGICQVATTVFNAVYESGLPIKERHNHSLYIASYPQGRDAAVSYPELDLVWQNDTANDVLVKVSCSEGSVTATLYGVDSGYQVSTETGQWEKGKTHSSTTKVDDTLAPGTSYVKTRGTDGSTIEVTRTVKDAAGNIVRQDLFASVYDPVNEVVVKGPDTAAG